MDGLLVLRLAAEAVGVVLVALVAAAFGRTWWKWAPLGLLGAGTFGVLILVLLEIRKRSQTRVRRVPPDQVRRDR